MELYKRKENYADPVSTAKKNFFALGILYLIISWIMYTKSGIVASSNFIAIAILMVIASILLGKRNVVGTYLGWLYVIFGVVSTLMNGAWLSLIIAIYIGYWNLKAYSALKNPPTPKVAS